MELVIDRGVKSYDVKDADGTLLGVITVSYTHLTLPTICSV